MNTVRTTITVPEDVLEHIKSNISDGDSISEFFTRAAVNQLERECSDFEIRDMLEEEE